VSYRCLDVEFTAQVFLYRFTFVGDSTTISERFNSFSLKIYCRSYSAGPCLNRAGVCTSSLCFCDVFYRALPADENLSRLLFNVAVQFKAEQDSQDFIRVEACFLDERIDIKRPSGQ